MQAKYTRKLTCKCGKLKERPNQGYCNSCKNNWSNVNRPKYSELTKIEKQKISARSIIKMGVKRGTIPKGFCFCGEMQVEAHHEDYSKPLEVEWLCREHHLERHHKIQNGIPYKKRGIDE